MARSSCHARTSKPALLLGLLAVCSACSTTQARRSAAPDAEPSVRPESEATPVTVYEPGVELPLGPGRDILFSACLGCHELTALALFKGFYTRDSWHDLVVTMRANGAEVTAEDVEVLSDYLTVHFGTGAQ